MTKSKEFSAQYLAEHLAEMPDEASDDSMVRAKAIASTALGSAARRYMRSEFNLSRIEEATPLYLHVRATKTSICLLPIWFLHFTWKGEHLLCTINGQTGKCVSELPVDMERRKTVLTLSAAPLALPLLFLVIGALALLISGDSTNLGRLLLYALLYVALLLWYCRELRADDNRRVRKMKTATKAEEGTNSPEAVFEYFHRREQRLATKDATRTLTSPVDHHGLKDQLMFWQAARLCNVFCNDAKHTGINITRDSSPCYTPNMKYGENLLAVWNHAVVGYGEYAHGFFFSDAGMYCCESENRNAIFMTWESYAKAPEPVLRDNAIWSGGATIAYDHGREILRKPLLKLYQHLHKQAESIYLHATPTNIDQLTAIDTHNLLMAERAREICEMFTLHEGDKCLNVSFNLFINIEVPDSDQILLAHDDTYNDSGKYGFIVASSGIYCKEGPNNETVSVSWEQLVSLDEPHAVNDCVRVGRLPLMRYTGESSVSNALLELCRSLHSYAQMVFFGNAESERWCMQELSRISACDYATRAQRLFFERARSACEAFLARVGYENFRDTTRYRNHLHLDGASNILLIHGTIAVAGRRCAFAIADTGFHCASRSQQGPRHISWEDFARAGAITQDQREYYADGELIAVFEGQKSTQPHLLGLFKELHKLAREQYN